MYPEFFPEGCPPADGNEGEQVLFRLTKAATPQARDFLSKWELGSPEDFTGQECLACGLSVLVSLDDAKALQREMALVQRTSADQCQQPG